MIPDTAVARTAAIIRAGIHKGLKPLVLELRPKSIECAAALAIDPI